MRQRRRCGGPGAELAVDGCCGGWWCLWWFVFMHGSSQQQTNFRTGSKSGFAPPPPPSLCSMPQVKDIMAHLYFKAKESFAQQAPKEVRSWSGGRSLWHRERSQCAREVPRSCLPWLWHSSAPDLCCGGTKDGFLSPGLTLARPQVRILKYLLTIESERDRAELLAQAFQPGAACCRLGPLLGPGCPLLEPPAERELGNR